MTITMNDIEKRVADSNKIGLLRVNICHEDMSHEGIWACFATDRDKTKYDTNTHYDLITIYLMNNALVGFPTWGLKIIVVTNACERPIISISNLLKQYTEQTESNNYPLNLQVIDID